MPRASSCVIGRTCGGDNDVLLHQLRHLPYSCNHTNTKHCQDQLVRLCCTWSDLHSCADSTCNRSKAAARRSHVAVQTCRSISQHALRCSKLQIEGYAAGSRLLTEAHVHLASQQGVVTVAQPPLKDTTCTRHKYAAAAAQSRSHSYTAAQLRGCASVGVPPRGFQ